MSDYKYTIIKHENQCNAPQWNINGEWVPHHTDVEQDEALIDYILSNLKERIKTKEIFIDDLLGCIRCHNWEACDHPACAFSDHYVSTKTTWKI